MEPNKHQLQQLIYIAEYHDNKISKPVSIFSNYIFIITVYELCYTANANRSACVHNLRLTLETMNELDYRLHVETILNRTCGPQDSRCLNIRRIYIDLVARAGDVTSQKIILKNVLRVQEPVEDEIRRVFIHCIVIDKPTQVPHYKELGINNKVK